MSDGAVWVFHDAKKANLFGLVVYMTLEGGGGSA
jgi:hypothetical protein